MQFRFANTVPNSTIFLGRKLSACQNIELLFYLEILEGAQGVIYWFQFSPCETPIYFYARKVYRIKYFFPFISEHVPIPELLASEYIFVISKELMVFCLMPESFVCRMLFLLQQNGNKVN